MVDPAALIKEINYLRDKGVEPKLKISDRAHIIMPYHIEMDVALTKHQGKLAAGSTKRGIAPVYGDKMYRHGIRMVDITEPDIFREKLDKAFSFNQTLIEAFGHSAALDKENIYDQYIEYGETILPTPRPWSSEASKLSFCVFFWKV